MGNVPRTEKAAWVKPSPTKWRKREYSDKLKKFYNSATWRKTSKRQLAEHPVCEECKKKRMLTRARVADHIIPVRQGGHPLSRLNLQSLCHPCHNRKSASEAGGHIEEYCYIGKYKIPKRNAEQK